MYVGSARAAAGRGGCGGWQVLMAACRAVKVGSTFDKCVATASGMATAAAPAMHVGDGVARRAAHHARRAEETRLAEGEPAHNGGEVARGEPAQVADAISSTSFVSALGFGFAVSTFAWVRSAERRVGKECRVRGAAEA